jgi:D-aminopeptidase
MPRFSDFDLVEDFLPSGALNSITDVAGVRVGHYTLVSGDGEWQPGKGPFRTGVTVILPHDRNLYSEKVPAAVHTINGFGKVAGFEQIRELGNIETPIA